MISTNIIATPAGPAKVTSNIGGLGIGFIREGSSEVGVLSWRPDFHLGAWGLGLDVNIPLGNSKPSYLEYLVLRYVEYDDSAKGLRYGVLDNVTLGHGLIMSNYTTRVGNQVLLTNQQMGTRGYIDFNNVALRGMYTNSKIYYARVEEKVHSVLTLGQYYVADSVGRSITQTNGTIKKFPAVAGIGLDATLPLPANLEGFAEVGQLVNYGNGLSAGVSWAYDLFVANMFLLGEYRVLDKGFVPEYFDYDYETNPVDLASAEASGQKNGFVLKAGGSVFNLVSLIAAYENYQNSNPSLNADLTANLGSQLGVHGYFRQPNFMDYRSTTLEQGAIMGADVSYKINPLTALIWHYKQAFNPSTGKVETTQYYEIGLNI